METTLTKAEILNETISYYSEDINRRAVIYNDNNLRRCMYSTDDNKHCAVGRCLTKESQIQIKKESFNFSAITDLHGYYILDKILQPQYKGHEVEFWARLQDLHDRECNWNHTSNGLTEEGEELVEQIKKEFIIK